MKPQKLYRQNILEYRSYLININKISAKTLNAKISALIKFNEFLQMKDLQNDIVVTKKDIMKVQQQFASPATISKSEVEKFRQVILEAEGSRNFTIVTIMAYTGLRISEVLNLRLDDFDLVSREIKVASGKGSKERIVYINSKIVDAIKEYSIIRKYNESDFLFVSNKGNRIDRTVINRVFQRYSKKITPHSLRHFYCSNALENGFSVHEVANQAGHSNIHTTLLYTNLTKEKMKNKVELL